MEILREYEKEILEIKSIVTEMKNVFHCFIIRMDIAEKINSVLEDISKRILKTKKQREQR